MIRKGMNMAMRMISYFGFFIFVILYRAKRIFERGFLEERSGSKLSSQHFEMNLAMSEYIYSAISNRRICAAYAHFGSQSHLDRHTT